MSTTFQESKITTGPLMEEPKKNDSDSSKSEEMISTIKREHDSTDDFERVEPENLLFVGGEGGGGDLLGKKEEGGSFEKETKGEVKAEVEVEIAVEKKKEEKEVLLKKEEKEEEKGEKKEGEKSVEKDKSESSSLPATISSTTEPPRVQDHHPGDSTDLKINTDHQLPNITKRSSFLNEDQEGEEEEEEKALPATPPPSADIEKYNSMADPFQRPAGRTTSAEGFNPRAATVAFVETERAAASSAPSPQTLSTNSAENTVFLDFFENTNDLITNSTISDQTKMNFDQSLNPTSKDTNEKEAVPSSNLLDLDSFQSSTTTTTTTTITPPVPSTKVNTNNTDLLSTSNHEIFEHVDDNITKNDKKTLDDRWNVNESVDVLPTITKKDQNDVNVNDIIKETIATESTIKRKDQNDDKTINSDKNAESKSTSIATKTSTNVAQDIGHKDGRYFDKSRDKIQEIEIAPKEIFRDMGLVATLIYWRDPKKSGAVFGATLGLLLSLAYFSLISVLAYLSLLILIATVAFRIYKSVLQAIQKTSDGHPFKYVLDLDLTLPTEKVHELADIAVAHVNATISELRRLFLVEDIVDSLKFGVLLWCFTYIGSWFNGMTLIIIGVVALFTLPKVYETNKTQIDENLALVKGKVDEFTAKIKAAIPLVKKPEPTKED
ncbi:reticulon-1 isoform X2 [Vespa velutina]|uniref:reticulon-1 isoform X2 n=1 Tax=Vespa velutina TaxID=202808 RepID=UPI001FB1DD2B|nr:reticulon-1 isoform X2 [Vespa velutina]